MQPSPVSTTSPETSPPPSPSSRRSRRVPPPAFGGLPPEPTPPPAGEGEPPASPPPADEAPFETDYDDDPGDAKKPGPETTGRGSSRVSFADRAALREAIATGIRVTTHQLNELLTRDVLERDHYGLWIADEQDVDGLSTPTASLIARRGGLAGAASPDLADLIALAIAGATYAGKQIALRLMLRKHRRAIANGEAPPPPDMPPAEEPGE